MDEVNALVDQLVRRCEAAFADRVIGYYLVGSYAVGEATRASDVDIVVVFRAPLDEAGQALFSQVRAACRASSPLMLDCSATSEEHLMRVGGVWFQTASRLLSGEDIRPRVPQKSAVTHARDLMHGVLPLMLRLRGDPPSLALPVEFPDPAGLFYGYDQRTVVVDGEARPVGTKDLVSVVLGIANALTWKAAGQYVGGGRKRDIPEQYALVIGDRWAPLVATVFERCRGDWGYQVPASAPDIAELRALCEEALGFENHFLTSYCAFLETEQQDVNPQVVSRAAKRAALLVKR